MIAADSARSQDQAARRSAIQEDRFVLQVAPEIRNHRVEIHRRQDDPDADLGKVVAYEVPAVATRMTLSAFVFN